MGGADWPLNLFQVEYALDGDTIAVGFGPDASKIDAGDSYAVQAELSRLVPAVEILEEKPRGLACPADSDTDCAQVQQLIAGGQDIHGTYCHADSTRGLINRTPLSQSS